MTVNAFAPETHAISNGLACVFDFLENRDELALVAWTGTMSLSKVTVFSQAAFRRACRDLSIVFFGSLLLAKQANPNSKK